MADGRKLKMTDGTRKDLADARASSAARLRRLRDLHERSLTLRGETQKALAALEAEVRRLKRAAAGSTGR